MDTTNKYIQRIKKGSDTYDIKAALIQDCYIDGVKFNGSKSISHYGICNTSASVKDKEITVGTMANDISTLEPGLVLYIKFTNGIKNLDSDIQFNVNSSGWKHVDFGHNNKFNYAKNNFLANKIQLFIYNNDIFYWINQPINDMNFLHGRCQTIDKRLELPESTITMIPLDNNYRDWPLYKNDPKRLAVISDSGYQVITKTSKENGTAGGFIIPETGYYQVSGGASFISPYDSKKPNRRLDVYIDGISGSSSDKQWSINQRAEIADGATFATVPYQTQIPVIVGPKIVYLAGGTRIYLSARIKNYSGQIAVGHKDTYLDIKYIGNM